MPEHDAFATAKRLSLLAFFEQYVAPPIQRHGMQAMFDTCPSCGPARRRGRDRVSVREDAKWHCFACNEGGTIVDAARLLWRVGPLEAARRLAGGWSTPTPRRDVRQAEYWKAREQARQQSLRVALELIFDATRSSWDLEVERYLVGRGITREVIGEAGRRGLLGALPSEPDAAAEWLVKVVGSELLEDSGLWKQGKPRPWIAYRPLVFFAPGLASAEFRVVPRSGCAPTLGSKSISVGRHQAPYWWHRPSARCLVVEGMIDLMSAVVLGFPGCLIGVAGVGNWRIEWFTHAAQRHGITAFEIAFDSDVDSERNVGQIAARRLQRICFEAGLRAVLCGPQFGDLNDLLQIQLEAKGRSPARAPAQSTR